MAIDTSSNTFLIIAETLHIINYVSLLWNLAYHLLCFIVAKFCISSNIFHYCDTVHIINFVSLLWNLAYHQLCFIAVEPSISSTMLHCCETLHIINYVALPWNFAYHQLWFIAVKICICVCEGWTGALILFSLLPYKYVPNNCFRSHFFLSSASLFLFSVFSYSQDKLGKITQSKLFGFKPKHLCYNADTKQKPVLWI